MFIHYDEITKRVTGYTGTIAQVPDTWAIPTVEAVDFNFIHPFGEYEVQNGSIVHVGKSIEMIDAERMALITRAEIMVNTHIQKVVDDYNTSHLVSFRDVHSCANYQTVTGYTHQQFCVDVWAFNVNVWEVVRNTIMPTIDFNAPPTEAAFVAMLPVYNGVV